VDAEVNISGTDVRTSMFLSEGTGEVNIDCPPVKEANWRSCHFKQML
jgi:hypothetical protein